MDDDRRGRLTRTRGGCIANDGTGRPVKPIGQGLSPAT